MVFFFNNLVGYKNPEEKIIINDINNQLSGDLIKIKNSNVNKYEEILSKKSFLGDKRNKNDIKNHNNLDFIDFNFLNSNRENLDNVLNNIIRLRKGIGHLIS